MEAKNFNEAIETINREIKELENKKRQLIKENSEWFVMRIEEMVDGCLTHYYVGMGHTVLSEAEKYSVNVLNEYSEDVYDSKIFAVSEETYALYRKWKWSEQALEYAQCYLSGTGVLIYKEAKPQLEENIVKIKEQLHLYEDDEIDTEQFKDY